MAINNNAEVLREAVQKIEELSDKVDRQRKLAFISVILNGSYKMIDICKDRKALRHEYEQFIQTNKGKEWKHFWQCQTGSERSGDFGDYLYDFYPEMLQ